MKISTNNLMQTQIINNILVFRNTLNNRNVIWYYSEVKLHIIRIPVSHRKCNFLRQVHMFITCINYFYNEVQESIKKLLT